MRSYRPSPSDVAFYRKLMELLGVDCSKFSNHAIVWIGEIFSYNIPQWVVVTAVQYEWRWLLCLFGFRVEQKDAHSKRQCIRLKQFGFLAYEHEGLVTSFNAKAQQTEVTA